MDVNITLIEKFTSLNPVRTTSYSCSIIQYNFLYEKKETIFLLSTGRFFFTSAYTEVNWVISQVLKVAKRLLITQERNRSRSNEMNLPESYSFTLDAEAR